MQIIIKLHTDYKNISEYKEKVPTPKPTISNVKLQHANVETSDYVYHNTWPWFGYIA